VTFSHRFALTIAVCLIILFSIALCGFLTGRWSEAAGEPLQPDTLSKYEQQFIDLDRQAIADAYRQQIQHLFLTWAKDEQQQPRRAVTGAKQARAMFERAMDAVEARAQRLQRERPQ
jgi:hypothetical protein